ncbi:MAG: DNA translocase FtsK 4TM domain-containing protein [Gemmataceae bacterium]
MTQERAWRLDLSAFLLLVVGLLVAAAVFSHDPGVVHPPPASAANVLGAPGDWVAGELVRLLGVAVYAWLTAWFVFVLMLLLRRRWWAWAKRFAGWLLVVPLTALLAHRHGEAVRAGPLVGPGGSLGATLDAWCDEYLTLPQQLALLAVLAVGVALLTADWLLASGWRLLRRGLRGLSRVRLSRQLTPQPVVLIEPPVISVPAEEPVEEVVEELEEEAPEPVKKTPPVKSEEIQGIPITHHGMSLLPEVARGEDEPELEERATLNLSNGLHSERERFAGYELPPLHLLEDPRPFAHEAHDRHLRETATLLEKTFLDFGLTVKVVGISTGPVVTMYEVSLETGLRVAKVTSLADDLALHLKVPSVRMVAPLPGKNAVGIEIPNEHRAEVRLKEVIQASVARTARARVPLFLGKDAEGRPLVFDLAEMPHLLIAGTTGTGKSVCLNAIILSLLMSRRPDELRMILMDPKRGVEMECFSRVPHLMCPIIDDMKKAEAVLAWAVDKMEERYDLLRRARVRNIAGYNELSTEELLRRVQPLDDEERQRIPERMSYIVMVIDEMSDLMMQFKKEVEGYIVRLAQKSRAAGIHLVLATQKPTVDVITGLIKSNLPSRICFKVAARSDSRVVLDQMGADKLLGKGDLLFLPPGTSDLVRAQGAFASDSEIAQVANYLESEPCYEAELLQLKTKEAREAEEDGGSLVERLKSRDKLYEQAVDVIIREGRGSVSLLQRSLGIGYGRAARLIDFMAQDGIVGTYNGANARDVLYTPEQWADLRRGNDDGQE